ncbi:hypothetical protein LTR86_010733 [Recurvomyces mirabilis]|nr:hypothetical protein LTR86_010733 [Recurvomyces mirabilis]
MADRKRSLASAGLSSESQGNKALKSATPPNTTSPAPGNPLDPIASLVRSLYPSRAATTTSNPTSPPTATSPPTTSPFPTSSKPYPFATLPPELLYQILAHLPTPTLLLCRQICRTFASHFSLHGPVIARKRIAREQSRLRDAIAMLHTLSGMEFLDALGRWEGYCGLYHDWCEFMGGEVQLLGERRGLEDKAKGFGRIFLRRGGMGFGAAAATMTTTTIAMGSPPILSTAVREERKLVDVIFALFELQRLSPSPSPSSSSALLHAGRSLFEELEREEKMIAVLQSAFSGPTETGDIDKAQAMQLIRRVRELRPFGRGEETPRMLVGSGSMVRARRVERDGKCSQCGFDLRLPGELRMLSWGQVFRPMVRFGWGSHFLDQHAVFCGRAPLSRGGVRAGKTAAVGVGVSVGALLRQAIILEEIFVWY